MQLLLVDARWQQLVPSFATRVRPVGGKLSGPPTSTALRLTMEKCVTQKPAVTHINANSVVAPMHFSGATNDTPPTLPVCPPPPPLPGQRLPVRTPLGTGSSMPTPVSHTVLSKALIGYHPNVVTYLVNGFKHGFRLGCYNLPVATTKIGITAMVHVINDFLLMAHSEAKCLHDLQVFCGPLFRTWHSIGSK